MLLNSAERSDLLNIGLMLIAAAVAILIPLELFLFSYAVLGPLHYLTEISWLHDRRYFTKGRYDAMMLLVIALLACMGYYSLNGNTSVTFNPNWVGWLSYVALLSAAIFAFVTNTYVRIAGLVLIVITTQLSEHFILFFAVFLPTLVHVYVFTGFFMLHGALKSGSRLGLVALITLVLCPVLLFTLFPDITPWGMTQDGIRMYLGGDSSGGFIGLNIAALSHALRLAPGGTDDPTVFWLNQVFRSKAGILLFRFIAFAYTYHYLNWFAKTRIIQWHKVPRKRFIGVIVFWLVSIILYARDFRIGFIWLFFLSYLHVLLELPLNVSTVSSVGKFCCGRLTGSTKASVASTRNEGHGG